MPEQTEYKIAETKFDPVDAFSIWKKIYQHNRPLIVAGVGIRQAWQVDEFIEFVENYQIPFITTYGAQDYASYDHPLNIGTPGVRGNRAGNFAMQNADLLMFIGTSLGSTVVGYDPKQFNPTAYKIYVDVEWDELQKDIIPIDWKIHTDLKQFFGAME